MQGPSALQIYLKVVRCPHLLSVSTLINLLILAIPLVSIPAMFNIAAILRGRWIAIIYAAAILLPLLGLAMIGHINDQAIAPLILRELNQHPGRMPVCLIPMQREKLVKQMYDWGARNCEIHFCQVYGKFQSFDGISMPTFLPETG